ncbi:MAG: hypothetical protein ACHP84_17325, partial [Caulobacterales bacterium]
KAGTQAFLQSVGAARVWTEGTNKKRLGPRLRGEFRVLVFGGVRASVRRSPVPHLLCIDNRPVWRLLWPVITCSWRVSGGLKPLNNHGFQTVTGGKKTEITGGTGE